ncbi:MAG: aquaporin [Candidatus Dormiibacterota bacterium]
MNPRSIAAELLGTALLVFFGAGTATLTFGFKLTGGSPSAGIVATALVFGLVLLALVYGIGPISGCHINPAVTIGFLVARRITIVEAIGYWIAQFVGGIVGAAGLFGVMHLSSMYKSSFGLGADGFGAASMIGLNAGGAFIAEVILTAVFVFVILATTRAANAAVAGLVIGFTLSLVHLIGIPLDGTSVNPARSLGPAIFVGGDALSQLWVFIVAPLVGGVLAALLYLAFYGSEKVKVTPEEAPQPAPELAPDLAPSEGPTED